MARVRRQGGVPRRVQGTPAARRAGPDARPAHATLRPAVDVPANAAVPWAERLHWFEELARASLPVVRPAARAILLDRRDRVFLHRFVVPGDPGVWITPGGALEDGESLEDALRRELAEELQLDDVDLGPWVWTRRHVGSGRRTVRSTTRASSSRSSGSRDVRAVKPTSHDSLFAGPGAREEHRWWTIDEIERSEDEFAPRALEAHLRDADRARRANAPVDVGR